MVNDNEGSADSRSLFTWRDQRDEEKEVREKPVERREVSLVLSEGKEEKERARTDKDE